MPVHIPLDRHATVVPVLREAAQVNGDVEAYVEPAGADGRGRRALTFAQWDRAADGVAGYLSALGVQKGDVVCLMLPSCIDYAVCYAALLRLGAVTSGINSRMGAAEVASIIERTVPVLVVADPDSAALPDVRVPVLERGEVAAAASGDPPSTWPALTARDPVAVVWTSGTTGTPKGAVFDHENLAAVARGTDVLSRPGDRRLSPLPFAHVGYMTRAWDEIAHAVTTVITPTPWRADDAVRIIGAESITVAQGVPTQWSLMLASDALATADLGALRVAGTGAARVPASLVAELRRRLGVPVVVRYTSTESSLGTGTTLTSSDEEVATTVGRPVSGVELAIVNDDDGTPVATGSVGRVLLRSAAAMRGYWGQGPGRGRRTEDLVDAEATAAVLAPDGWLRTGDFGRLTPEGNLQLAGRAHERYIRGGYNVYPAEVEDALASHPAVDRVAVTGAPDDVLGEIGVAVVVPKGDHPPDLEALRAHVATTLADYKAPDALVLVAELPLTPMMKVDPGRMAALAGEAATERSARLSRSRGAAAGVLGSEPDDTAVQKEHT
jgi:acyl-CoA synthetase (AMP-forming)/AMP-acid ligase II